MGIKQHMNPSSMEQLTRMYISSIDAVDYYLYRSALVDAVSRLGRVYDLSSLSIPALFRIGEQYALALQDSRVSDKKLKAKCRNELRSRFQRKYFYRSIERKLAGDKLTRYDQDNLKVIATWHYVYGRPWQGEEFQLDHIKPLCLAASPREYENYNRISNVAMLSPTENLVKSSKYPNNIDILIRINRCANNNTDTYNSVLYSW